MTNKSIYFLHIPKTAGVSVKNWLNTLLSDRKTCPEYMWSLLLQMDPVEVRKYDLYLGHFYSYLDEYLGKPLDTLTFLRNPVERSFSHFRHILRDPSHPFHEKVCRHRSFKEFILDPETQPLIKNFQVRALSSKFKPWEMRNNAPTDFPHPYWLDQQLTIQDDKLSTSEALFIAKNMLLQCKAFGIVERMDESAFLIAHALGVKSYAGVEQLNIDHENAHLKISHEEMKLLSHLLEADMDLYNYALRIFDARLLLHQYISVKKRKPWYSYLTGKYKS